MDNNVKRVVELVVKTDAASIRRLDEIARSAKGVEDRLGRAQKSASDFASLGLGAIAAYVSVGAIVNGLSNVAKALDDIGDAAERAGTSAGAMGFLQELGKLNELDDLATLERGLKAFNVSMAEANDEGSKAAQMFRAMRLELTDGDPVGNLAKFAVEYKKIESASLRAAVQQEIFGKSGHALHQTLIALADSQGDLSTKISEYEKKNLAAIIAAGELDKNIRKLKQHTFDLSVVIAGPLIASLNDFIDRANSAEMGGALGRIREIVREILTATTLFKDTDLELRSSGRLKEGKIQRPGEVDARVLEMEARLKSALSNNKTSGVSRSRTPKEIKEKERSSSLDESEAMIQAAQEAAFEKRQEFSKKVFESATAGIRAEKEYLEIIKQLDSQLQSNLITQAEYNKLKADEQEKLIEFAEPQRAVIISLEKAERAREKEKTLLEERMKLSPAERDLLAGEATSYDKLAASIERLAATERNRVTNAQITSSGVSRLDQARLRSEFGSKGASWWDKTVDKALLDEAEQTKDSIMQVSDAISSAAGDMVEAMWDADNDLGDIFDSIAERYAKMLMQMQIESGMRQLTNAAILGINGVIQGLSTSGSGAMHFDDWGTGSAKGNVFGPAGRIKAFGSGGLVNRPTLFGDAAGGMNIMGEAGTEGIFPLRRGNDGKLGVQGAAPIVNVPVEVVIENKSSAQVSSVKEGRGQNGQQQIRVMIEEAMAGGVASGKLDTVMGTRFGLTAQGRR